jgi:hypothetical protein
MQPLFFVGGVIDLNVRVGLYVCVRFVPTRAVWLRYVVVLVPKLYIKTKAVSNEFDTAFVLFFISYLFFFSLGANTEK